MEVSPLSWFVAGVLSVCCLAAFGGAAGALVWLLLVRSQKPKDGTSVTHSGPGDADDPSPRGA